jgi:predicted nucleotidyltransferase
MILNNTEKLILEEFSKNRSKRIYGREIADKFHMNQKTISNVLNNMERENILKFKTEGKNKYYFLNENNPHIREVIKIVELFKKISFLEKNRKLEKLFQKIEDKTKGIAIIFGSYAKGTQTPKSDMDLFILGNIGETRELEDSFGIEINVIKGQKDKFDMKEPFIREVMENHVILKGVEDFVNLTWSQ